MSKSFASIQMDQVAAPEKNRGPDWLWQGFLARGYITLFTSLWKNGKTTLVTGLLQQLGAGGPFLGQTCRACKALVVSEEGRELWADRLNLMPVGPHAQLLSRPFLVRPNPEQWSELIDNAIAQRLAGELDLFVVDPLAAFLPGPSESDMGTLLAMLQPLQRLASAGVAVLVLHHPRKEPSEVGSAARGSGALLGFVDIIMEMYGLSGLRSDERRRRLTGRSRFLATPRQTYFEWDPKTGAFCVVSDPYEAAYRENWGTLKTVLEKYEVSRPMTEILLDWPATTEAPSPTTLFRWLKRAHSEDRVRRQGRGSKGQPYRYRLTTDADRTRDRYRERGELPPLELFGGFGR